MTVKTQCLSVLVIELYLCVGGGLFYWLEFSDVTIQNDKSNQESNFSQILKEFSQYKGVEYDEAADELAQFIQDWIQNTSLPPRKLSTAEAFMASYAFAGSVITTIGFGTMVPVTVLGKILVIIYGAIGIPLCLVGFAQMGKDLSLRVAALCSKLSVKFNFKFSAKTVKVAELVGTVLFGAIPFVIIPCLVMPYVEDWSYIDGIYLLLVTFSTVGFGDIVPGVFRGELPESIAVQVLYVIFGTVITIGGVSWMATAMTITKDLMQYNLSEKDRRKAAPATFNNSDHALFI